MSDNYFCLTPLESDETYVTHVIRSSVNPAREWRAIQRVGMQYGYRQFDNPVMQHEIDDLEILSDPDLSGYQFDDGFDYIQSYDYQFCDAISEDEQASLIDAYENGDESDSGVCAAWVEMGDHEWRLVEEIICFCCPIKIDLIDSDANVIEEDVSPVQ